MTATVIDQLIVKLGLDPRDFTKGEKEVAASVLRTKKTVEDASRSMNSSVKDAADGIGGSFATVAKRATVLYLIFKGLSIATKFILEASRATRMLGNDSKNYDIAAARLRNFQNISEMFGGSAEDATKTVAGLQRAIFNLTFNGQMSDQLVMLARLGVRFQDAAGHARDFKDVFLDSAEAIQQAQANGTMTGGEAYQFLTQAGYDPGLARAALGGRGAAQAALDRQEARRQVTGADVAAATANEQAITSVGQAKDAAGVAAQRIASPLITGTASAAEGLINAGAAGDVSVAWEAWKKGIEPAAQALGDLADKARGLSDILGGAVHRLGRGRSAFEGTIQGAAKKYGVDPEILAGLLSTESGFDPTARNPKTGATGIAQFMPRTAAGRGFVAGQDPDRDIYEAARYLAELNGHFRKSGQPADAAMDDALMAYNAGERRVRTSSMMTEGGKDLTGETLAYPGQIYEYAEGARSGGGAGGGSSRVDIGEVNVYTQATDADGMADGAAGALQRKMNASHAEQGMQ